MCRIGERWNVAEAKAKLSEVLHKAQQGPQLVESRGREVAVVLGIEQYRRLLEIEARATPSARLADFLRLSRAVGAEGTADIPLPRRERRPSPFARSKK